MLVTSGDKESMSLTTLVITFIAPFRYNLYRINLFCRLHTVCYRRDRVTGGLGMQGVLAKDQKWTRFVEYAFENFQTFQACLVPIEKRSRHVWCSLWLTFQVYPVPNFTKVPHIPSPQWNQRSTHIWSPLLSMFLAYLVPRYLLLTSMKGLKTTQIRLTYTHCIIQPYKNGSSVS